MSAVLKGYGIGLPDVVCYRLPWLWSDIHRVVQEIDLPFFEWSSFFSLLYADHIKAQISGSCGGASYSQFMVNYWKSSEVDFTPEQKMVDCYQLESLDLMEVLLRFGVIEQTGRLALFRLGVLGRYLLSLNRASVKVSRVKADAAIERLLARVDVINEYELVPYSVTRLSVFGDYLIPSRQMLVLDIAMGLQIKPAHANDEVNVAREFYQSHAMGTPHAAMVGLLAVESSISCYSESLMVRLLSKVGFRVGSLYAREPGVAGVVLQDMTSLRAKVGVQEDYSLGA